MKWLFWISVAVVVYTYAGYPLLLSLRARWAARRVGAVPSEPSVTLVMAVRNEAGVIRAKFENLSQLRYPQDRIEILVVSDGSTDEAAAILSSLAVDRLRVIVCQENVGK